MFLPTELSLNVFVPLESWVHTQTIYALMSRNEYISVENVHFLPIDHIYLTKHWGVYSIFYPQNAASIPGYFKNLGFFI